MLGVLATFLPRHGFLFFFFFFIAVYFIYNDVLVSAVQ